MHKKITAYIDTDGALHIVIPQDHPKRSQLAAQCCTWLDKNGCRREAEEIRQAKPIEADEPSGYDLYSCAAQPTPNTTA